MKEQIDINTQSNQEDFYIALKRIEAEKTKEKKKKRLVGCGSVLLVLFALFWVAARCTANYVINHTNSTTSEIQSLKNEPVTLLDAKEILMYTGKNGIADGENKYEKHKSGYKYRYNCVAKVGMKLGEGKYLADLLYFDDDEKTVVKYVTCVIEYPENNLTKPDMFGHTCWIGFKNIEIDIYTNETGTFIQPIMNDPSHIDTEEYFFSEESAIEWLKNITEI